MRYVTVGMIVGALLCGVGCARAPRQAILITIDSLRDDYVGPRADGVSLTPELDRLRADGVRFDDAVTSATTTMASHASMLTGLRPHRHGLTGNDGGLDPGIPTLAGLLRARGVRTGAVVSSFVLRSEGGLAAGFDVYDETFDSHEGSRVGQRVKSPPATTRAALDFVKRHRRDSFFLWVHYFPPHGPYSPPAEYFEQTTKSIGTDAGKQELAVSAGNYERGKLPKYQRIDGVVSAGEYRSRYAAHVRYVDHHVGQLVAGLRELGVYDGALVVGTSDHGESLGEHGWYFCHGNLVYQEQARVPLLVKWPSAKAPHTHASRAPVELVDLMPTVLSFFGLPAARDLDGRDLTLVDAPHPGSDRLRITQSTDGELTAVILGPAKLTEHRGPARLVDERHPTRELFRLDRDSGELQNLVDKDPALVGVLSNLLPRCRRPLRQQDLSEETREQLRTLGYVVREGADGPCDTDGPAGTPKPR
jgi:choline-sulfatase